MQRKNTTCEIACFDSRELSLKGWQEARPMSLDQACNIGPISQVENTVVPLHPILGGATPLQKSDVHTVVGVLLSKDGLAMLEYPRSKVSQKMNILLKRKIKMLSVG